MKKLAIFTTSIIGCAIFLLPYLTSAQIRPVVSGYPRDISLGLSSGTWGANFSISGDGFSSEPGQVIVVGKENGFNIVNWSSKDIGVSIIDGRTFDFGLNRIVIRTIDGLESDPFDITISGVQSTINSVVSVNNWSLHLTEQADLIGSGFGNNGLSEGGIVVLTGTDIKQQIVSWSNQKIRIIIDKVPTRQSITFTVGVPQLGKMVYSTPSEAKVIQDVCTADQWDCNDWSECSVGGKKTRACNKVYDCNAVESPVPELEAICTPPCTADIWSCDDWNMCSIAGTQFRNCTKMFDCSTATTPSPAISQSCTPPQPACAADSWSCGDWNVCSANGTQTRSCTKSFDCPVAETASPVTTQTCSTPQPACNADTWTCGAWDTCSLSGIQNRGCTKTFDCPSVETAPPMAAQYCEVPNRPAQQVPQDSSDEISNQDAIIKSTVKLICPVDSRRASQGSGTVINPNGTLLTNKHVIAGTLGCLVGFINDFDDEPYFGARHIADVVKVSPNQDIAVLKIRNPQNKILPSVNITKGGGNFRLGTKITTYGFPAKFGTKVTYTSGDFSGTDGSYLKTTAILEYGNSGGGAYLKDGTFIGVPSAVVKGELNALGYILSISTINAWLGNSSIVVGGAYNNQYSRVSALEDIKPENLGSLKLFIPQTDASGNLATSAANQQKQEATQEVQPHQTQEESTVIESSDTKQNQTEIQKEQPKKISWVKRLFSWLSNLFDKMAK